MRKPFYLIPTLALALSVGAVPGRAQQSANTVPAPTSETAQVSSVVTASRRISGENPVYPAIAQAAHIQGTVVLQILISTQGKVEKLSVVSGPAMLQSAAADAVRTWTFEPYLLNGKPAPFPTHVNVVFSLAESQTNAAQHQAAGAVGSSSAGAQNPHQQAAQALAVPAEQLTNATLAGPPPAHPITADQVHEMLQLSGASRLRKQMLDTMMPMIRHTMPPYMPPDVLDDFESSFLNADFEAALLHTYQEHLSADDGAQIIAFYKTPAGQHLLLAMPQILRDSEAAGAQLAQQVMLEVIQRHQTEIDAAKLKYESQHPWSAPKN